MADLYPTKTRIALLRDVDAGRVTRTQKGHVVRRFEHAPGTRAEAAIREVVAAGWVQLNELGDGYELTRVGHRVAEVGRG